MLGSISRAYARANSSRPLTTSMVLGFIIAGTGDVICQVQEGRSLEAVDVSRVGELSVTRAAVMSPFLYWYFPKLSSVLPGSSWPRVIGRVCLDQAVGAPISLTIIFFFTSTLKGRPMEVKERLQERLLPTWYQGATYWPFVHLFNFKFVPLPHQSLFAHFASVWWMIQVSSAANAMLTASPSAEAHAGSPIIAP